MRIAYSFARWAVITMWLCCCVALFAAGVCWAVVSTSLAGLGIMILMIIAAAFGIACIWDYATDPYYSVNAVFKRKAARNWR